MKNHASMNRIYRLVWNAALNLWVAVAENAKGSGKSNRAGRAAAAVLSTFALLSPQAYGADAANATVSAGSGAVSTTGNTTTINQASQRLAIDWTSLSTRANEALKFVQPNAQAIALNRITGSSPSQLLGSLTANGQVFILNPNGVLFGAGSQVNVGGLVASTLNMSNADFEAGNFKFTGSGSGSVINQGTLTATAGGYLALLAPEVRNEGVMVASLGTALLAAGNKVTLNLDNGSLLGYSIDQGAINALAENKQLIKADGGQVLLSARAIDALTTATVNNTGVIEARTIQNKAGRIMLMGDMETGTVNVGGTLDASAPNGGDGGFIETSAARVKVTDYAQVTAKATSGKTGTWLIDPTDFTIGVDESGAHVAASLASADRSIVSTGDINVNEAVSWNAHKLMLSAGKNININADLHASGAASLALEYGQGALAAGNTSDYVLKTGVSITLPAGQTFSTRMGSDGVQKDYTVITSLGAEGSTTASDLQGMNGNRTGNYALGGDIDAANTASWNSGAGFMPIGSDPQRFAGTFTGLGHSISNLTINRPSTDYVGLFGYMDANALVRNAGLVNASVTGKHFVGALVGVNLGGIIRNAYATGTVVGTGTAGYAGGLVGLNDSGTISNSHAENNVEGNGDRVGGLVGLNANGTIDTSYATGSVIAGNYHTDQYGSSIANSYSVGGLVGYSSGGTIRNSYATGSVSASGSGVGGLVGFNENGTISNSYATGNVIGGLRPWSNRVTGGERVGGLVGDNYSGTISNSYATGSVSGTGYWIGGLVGYSRGSTYRAGGNINNSYATGNVSGFFYVGGLVGYDYYRGTISNSYATGNVTGRGDYIGGLVGADYTSTTSNSYATGSVTATGNYGYAGGLVGFNQGTINNSYATGSVIGNNSSYAGGLVGGNLEGVISNSYATGSVTGNYTLGGLIGASTRSTITNSYWNIDTTGQASSAAGTGLSNAQIQQQASFTGFDFSNTWAIYEGHTSPLLRSFMKALTVTADVTRVYDGAAYAFNPATDVRYSVATDPALLNGTLSNSGASEGAIHVNQSGSAITLGGLWSGQQGYLISYTNSALTITPKTITVAATGVDKIYNGDAAATVTLAGSGVIAGDVVDFAGMTASFSDKNVGTGKVVTVSGISLGGAGAGDYSLSSSSASTTADITPKALTLTGVTAANKVYDQGTGATVNTAGAVYGGLIAGDAVTVSATGAFSDKNAATEKTVNLSGSYSGTDVGNYAITGQASTTASISQAALTISGITASDKTYNASDAATVSTAGAAYSGLFAGDVVSVAATGLFSDKNAGTGKTVTLGSSYSGADVGNYVITNQASTTANISQANLTVSTSDVVKTYDTTTNALGTVVVTGGTVFSGDNLTGGSFVFANKNASTGDKAVNVSGVTVGDGVNNGNYNVTYLNNTTSTINQANLTLSSSNVTKTYDGGLSAGGSLVVTAGTIFAGDNATGGNFAFTDRNAGTGNKTVTTGGVTVGDGVNNGNYNISYADNTSSTINPFSVSLTGTRSYDGTASVATGVLNIGPLVGSETLGLTGSATMTDKTVGANKALTVAGLSLTDGTGLASNYSFTGGTQQASITQASLTLSTSDVTKTYDATLSAAGTAVVAGGTVFSGDSISGGSFAFTDKNAGRGNKTVITSGVTVGDGVNNANYNISYVNNTTSTITLASLSVVANNDSRPAGGTPYSGGSGVAYLGLVAGETAAVLGGAVTYGGSSQGASTAGSYAIAPGGYSAGNYAISYVNGVLGISSGGSAEAALGGPALVTAYGGALQAVGGLGASVGGSSGGDAGALATAAAEAGSTGEE